MSNYRYVFVYVDSLDDTLRDLSERQVKIVAVTQNGNFYTIFYQ